MRHQRPRSRPSAAFRLMKIDVTKLTGFRRATVAIFGVLVVAMTFLSACNREGSQDPSLIQCAICRSPTATATVDSAAVHKYKQRN